jgi:hypothetical protein
MLHSRLPNCVSHTCRLQEVVVAWSKPWCLPMHTPVPNHRPNPCVLWEPPNGRHEDTAARTPDKEHTAVSRRPVIARRSAADAVAT